MPVCISFTMRVIRHWQKPPEEIMESLIFGNVQKQVRPTLEWNDLFEDDPAFSRRLD